MSGKFDLETLREIMKDDSVHICLALVNKVTFADDQASVAVECTSVPEAHDILARVGFDSVGDNTASGDIPDAKDLVLVAFPEGERNHAVIISRLPSKEEKLPKQMGKGDYVVKAQPGKKLHLGSDTKVLLGKAVDGSDPTEPVVLGQVLATFLGDVVTAFDTLADQVKAIGDQVKALADQVNSLASTISSGPLTLDTITSAPESTAPSLVVALLPITIQIPLIKAQIATAESQITSAKTQLDNKKTSAVDQASSNILSQIAFTERGA